MWREKGKTTETLTKEQVFWGKMEKNGEKDGGRFMFKN